MLDTQGYILSRDTWHREISIEESAELIERSEEKNIKRDLDLLGSEDLGYLDSLRGQISIEVKRESLWHHMTMIITHTYTCESTRL